MYTLLSLIIITIMPSSTVVSPFAIFRLVSDRTRRGELTQHAHLSIEKRTRIIFGWIAPPRLDDASHIHNAYCLLGASMIFPKSIVLPVSITPRARSLALIGPRLSWSIPNLHKTPRRPSKLHLLVHACQRDNNRLSLSFVLNWLWLTIRNLDAPWPTREEAKIARHCPQINDLPRVLVHRHQNHRIGHSQYPSKHLTERPSIILQTFRNLSQRPTSINASRNDPFHA